VDQEGVSVSGRGELLGLNREPVGSGSFTVPIDSVALFETNVVQNSPAVAALAVVSGVSLGLTAFCLSNTKACFGSCPTFYVSDGTRPLLQAEGFSGSVTRALEASDIDALYRARPAGRDLEVRMRNEALETHVVRYVRLLAVPQPVGGRAFATAEGRFWQAARIETARACAAPEGSCLANLRSFDGVERFSAADSTDLATRETVDLEFAAAGEGPVGIVIGARQSLLSTYVFYQALAYLGRSAGEWLALLERGDPAVRERSAGIGRALGWIEVLVQDRSGAWVGAGAVSEIGPLAPDLRLVLLPDLPDGPVRVRLRLTRGHWRLDYAALAALGRPVEPVRLEPYVVRRNGLADTAAAEALRDSTRGLTTLPGDEYTLLYRLPAEPQTYELFLETRGYYLEWMRREWLAEEDPLRAAELFMDPRKALRTLAPEFKRHEAGLERSFWGSRYVRR